ncbi:MAG TPA: alternative ribosome rescue aminoacyl-tRNA hydrolase ArfB [Vicinamibacterales bacterium]|nr:alternative ribosome rescue aminoacyl-tRNA hydrolase ArfB [Vicinamibacterales bacterium]
MGILRVTPALAIDDRAIVERFVRASGPGGQNVNKVATAVELRVDLGRLSLADDVKARLRRLAGRRMTDADVLVVEAREHRTQAQNREAARARLEDLVRHALRPPKSRRKTRPTAASKERRLQQKQQRAAKKETRRRPVDAT